MAVWDFGVGVVVGEMEVVWWLGKWKWCGGILVKGFPRLFARICSALLGIVGLLLIFAAHS